MVTNSPASRSWRAFTLVELLVTVGIIMLVIAISIPVMESFRERARKAKCISHLRNIHQGFTGYVTDVGHWPQLPQEMLEGGASEEDFFGFWISALEPYGLSQESWVCPSDRALERRLNETKQEYFGSYIITQFDDRAKTPFRWNQPWAMERGNFHGQGPHILMPDGSIQSANNPFHGR